MDVYVMAVTGRLQEQAPDKDTRRSEPQTPAVREMGTLGHLVQVPATGSHQVRAAVHHHWDTILPYLGKIDFSVSGTTCLRLMTLD